MLPRKNISVQTRYIFYEQHYNWQQKNKCNIPQNKLKFNEKCSISNQSVKSFNLILIYKIMPGHAHHTWSCPSYLVMPNIPGLSIIRGHAHYTRTTIALMECKNISFFLFSKSKIIKIKNMYMCVTFYALFSPADT